MKKWHPCMFIPLLWCGMGETGTELLNSVAPGAKAPYDILKGVFQDPLSDSTLLLAFPFSRQPNCHDGWQCPGVMPGSCTSPLCALCWSPLSVVCTSRPCVLQQLGAVLSPGGSPYCSVPTRGKTNQEQQGKIWSVSTCFQVINMQANMCENEC